MKFCDRETFWTLNKPYIPRGASIRDVYLLASSQFHSYQHRHELAQLLLEYWWHEDRCPYYNVYIPIARMLANVSLDIDCKHVTLPQRVLVIRFPENTPLSIGEIKERKLRSMMIGFFDNATCKRIGVNGAGLGIWLDRGERGPKGFPVYDFQTLLLKEGVTIEESLSNYVDFDQSDDPLALKTGVRIAVGVSLIANDPELIMPDVLSRDANKPITQNIIDRAHRRGKIGWLIGKGIEVSPHFRRPHFGIRWTGEGKTIPKLVPIKGAIVHRSAVENIPTGKLEDKT